MGPRQELEDAIRRLSAVTFPSDPYSCKKERFLSQGMEVVPAMAALTRLEVAQRQSGPKVLGILSDDVDQELVFKAKMFVLRLDLEYEVTQKLHGQTRGPFKFESSTCCWPEDYGEGRLQPVWNVERLHGSTFPKYNHIMIASQSLDGTTGIANKAIIMGSDPLSPGVTFWRDDGWVYKDSQVHPWMWTDRFRAYWLDYHVNQLPLSSVTERPNRGNDPKADRDDLRSRLIRDLGDLCGSGLYNEATTRKARQLLVELEKR